jgi:hypothetical protein
MKVHFVIRKGNLAIINLSIIDFARARNRQYLPDILV